ncbi:sodium-coupled monocarboxylate transporter 1-like isoform X2 [Zophobas morio]|uniref:sodium-coupled monocarboxylate transporter 1-like isoform X2 n=1 Tax=Zophobas morio TaxID=2755281 RepID=UPI003082F145
MDDFDKILKTFYWPDYLMLILILLISLSIGFYFGAVKGFKSTEDYLMGNRKMQLFPITMSLIASYVSGISILGIPTDVYLYGIHYIFSLIGLVITSVIMNYIYLPVFYNLKLTSCYEYYEKRFDKKVRIFGSVLFGINTITWIALVMYVSALTLNKVTGLSIHLITPTVCIVCILYTLLGGLKAVVWTDAVQSIIMLCSLLLLVIKGTFDVGGLHVVLERNLKSGRIEGPSLDLNPTSRYTLWSLSIGAAVYFLVTTCTDQTMLQRYLALPSLKKAKSAMYLFVIGYGIFVALCCYSGLLLYATFYKCDPLKTQLPVKKDQLLLLLVMKVLSTCPGLPGIFIAGTLSACLSSLSTGLNSMAAVVVQDCHNFYFKQTMTETKAARIMQLTIIFSGTMCVCLVYLIQQLGTILQVYMSVGAITNGASLGLFTAGIIFPSINNKGALMGGISSLVFMAWLCFKAQAAISSGELLYIQKPLTTETCPPNLTHVRLEADHLLLNASTLDHSGFNFYHVSYLWYTLIGTTVVIVGGLIISMIIKDSKKVDPKLLIPLNRNKAEKTYSLTSAEENSLTSSSKI